MAKVGPPAHGVTGYRPASRGPQHGTHCGQEEGCQGGLRFTAHATDAPGTDQPAGRPQVLVDPPGALT